MSVNSEYKVGDKATYVLHTDRHAGTVIHVTAKSVTWQQDTVTRTDKLGMSDIQDYEYEVNPEGDIMKFTRRDGQDGKPVYKRTGQRTNSPGLCLVPGSQEHYDFRY